jgi:hypothetical protein
VWKEYERFEIGVDKALAKKLLADIQQRVGVAKTVYKERAAVMTKLSLTAVSLSTPLKPYLNPLTSSSKSWVQTIPVRGGCGRVLVGWGGSTPCRRSAR